MIRVVKCADCPKEIVTSAYQLKRCKECQILFHHRKERVRPKKPKSTHPYSTGYCTVLYDPTGGYKVGARFEKTSMVPAWIKKNQCFAPGTRFAYGTRKYEINQNYEFVVIGESG